MGDGRYYTYEQFFSVIALLMLVGFVLISTMSSYYKNTKSKGSKYITAIFIQLEIIVMARFIEEIIVSEIVAFRLRTIQNIFFATVCIMLANYLIRYVVATYYDFEVEPKSIKKINTFTYFLLGAIVLFIFIYEALTSKNLLIKAYSFFEIDYTDFYVLMLMLFFIIFTIISIRLYILKSKKEIVKSAIYKSKNISVIIFLMYGLPLVMYIIAIKTSVVNVELMELIIYLFFTIGINILVASFIPYGITSYVFSNVRDMILDYVFIIDNKGEIIYKNNRSEVASFFRRLEYINLDKIEEIFTAEVKKQSIYNKNFINYTDLEESKYFSYGIKRLSNKGKSMGAIITFTDITKLINMLNTVQEQKKNSEKINTELNKYSKTVYHLEKEREINSLLEEIAKTQDNAMVELKIEIKKIRLKKDDDDFVKHVDDMIKLAKDNLADVRKAVSAYMEYYGGRDD